MSVPAQKRHRSVQEVQTPRDFLDSVENRFGEITVDLAASNDNAIVPYYFGPGSAYSTDALNAAWCLRDGLLWLNPPYANIAPWAQKAAVESEPDCGASIAMLVPASVGANWFNAWVRPYAYVLELTPRLTFVGHKHAYPKDLILAVYTPERFVGRETWMWKTSRALASVPANDNGIDPRQMYLPMGES